MKKDGTLAYSCIFYLSLCLSVALVGHMAFDRTVALHTPQTPVQMVTTLQTAEQPQPTLRADILQEVLEQTPEWSPTSALSVQIEDNGHIHMQTELSRERLQSTLSLPSLTEKLLPERCTIAMTFAVGMQKEPQQFVVEPLQLAVNGVELSPDLLNPLLDGLEQAVTSAMQLQP